MVISFAGWDVPLKTSKVFLFICDSQVFFSGTSQMRSKRITQLGILGLLYYGGRACGLPYAIGTLVLAI